MKLSNNLNCLWQPAISILPYADFTIFNATYDITNQVVMCTTCNATGGFITTELVGDPPMTGYQDTFDACYKCIGAEKCPGCGANLALSFDLSAFGVMRTWHLVNYSLQHKYYEDSFSFEDALGAMPFVGFTCSCCGWQYNPDRHYDLDSGDDYYEDDYQAGLEDSDLPY